MSNEQNRTIQPNEPAFPFWPVAEFKQPDPGLTIRAELAARAMQGILANHIAMDMPHNPSQQQYVAECAVQLADALISELNKTSLNER